LVRDLSSTEEEIVDFEAEILYLFVGEFLVLFLNETEEGFEVGFGVVCGFEPVFDVLDGVGARKNAGH
jgi:hypothetical protein